MVIPALSRTAKHSNAENFLTKTDSKRQFAAGPWLEAVDALMDADFDMTV